VVSRNNWYKIVLGLIANGIGSLVIIIPRYVKTEHVYLLKILRLYPNHTLFTLLATEIPPPF
jgi:hypothetical protein